MSRGASIGAPASSGVSNRIVPATVVGGYGGDTTVSAGTLKLGAANVIPNGTGTGNVNVAGLLDLAGFSETIEWAERRWHRG